MEKYNAEQVMSTYADVLATVYDMLGVEVSSRWYYLDYQPETKWKLDEDYNVEILEDGEFYDIEVYGTSIWVSEHYTAIAYFNNGPIELIVLDNNNRVEE